jgi:hypothetical protein
LNIYILSNAAMHDCRIASNISCAAQDPPYNTDLMGAKRPVSSSTLLLWWISAQPLKLRFFLGGG